MIFLYRQYIMNRAVFEPEYFIYVHRRSDHQYPAFLKMIKADPEEYDAFIKIVEKHQLKLKTQLIKLKLDNGAFE